MLEQISEEELLFIESLTDPICMSECLFHDVDAMGLYDEEKFSRLRIGQFPMLSFEYAIDDDPKLNEKDNFRLKEGAGNLWCFGGRKFGKCTSIDSLITLSDGTLSRIGDLIGQKELIKSINQSSWKLEDSVAEFFDNGKRDCIKFVTHSFKSDIVTFNHPLLTQDGWKKAKDLKIGDYVGVVKQYNFLGNKKPTEKVAKLLGYLLGDGDCTQTAITFTNTNKELLDEVSVLVGQFNCQLKLQDKCSYYIVNKISQPYKKNKVNKLVEQYGLNKLAKDKNIPNEVFNWQDKYIALLINRLYACDGYVEKNGSIGITLASKQLIKDLQHLLIRFGVYSSIYYKPVTFKDKKFDSWSLYVTGYNNSKKFIREIGIKSKENKFDFNKKVKTKNRFVPEKFQDFDNDILWEKIKSLETVEKVQTVAVSVTGNNTYISNDVISHNTMCVEKLDIIMDGINVPGNKIGFSSYDAGHIEGILEDIIAAWETHPFLKIFAPRVKRNPYSIRLKTGWFMIGVNMNNSGQNPGDQFFQKHFKKLYIEEAAQEISKVYEKRIDAIDENGCIFRIAGMTNFTKYSPAGRAFYDKSLSPWIMNVPQYINPKWDEKERAKAIRKHQGEQSISYRIFVKGEVVEEGISVLDMERVRACYFENRKLKRFEISKDNFSDFKNNLIVERPNNAEACYISADVGESAPTEIVIIFQVNKKYKYEYNITCHNLTHKQQFELFLWLAQTVKANFVGIDTTDQLGRAIYRDLEEKIGKEHLVWCGFNEKIPIGFKKDDNGNIELDASGQPIEDFEFIDAWSVQRLKYLFYEGLMECPPDDKMDNQLNCIISKQSMNRVLYSCIAEEDHLLAAFRVFAISQWSNEFNLIAPVMTKKFCKSGA